MLALIALAVLAPADTPRLAVVISIDQFRPDYLTRFADLYLPAESPEGVGGFRWLAERGANFVNAKYNHVPTETGPGHAVIGTGSPPGVNGIIANIWYDRATGKDVYCVEDPDSKDVHTGQASFSPRNLRVSTFGDELKAASPRSAHVSIALKDRAAILLAGRMAEDVIWFDTATASWTTSDFYGDLSEWVVEVNGRRLPQAPATWTRSLPAPAYDRASVPENPSSPEAFGRDFPHNVTTISAWTRTPAANEFVFTTAKAAIEARRLGTRVVPDLLTLNLSPNDYLGHWFGPDSPQMLEMCVQSDRQLADFFRYLDRQVPGGLQNVFIVVTADHGVMPMVEELQKRGLPAGRVVQQEFADSLDAFLNSTPGNTAAVNHAGDYMIYLSGHRPADATALRDYLKTLPYVYTAFTRDELERGMAYNFVSPMLARSYDRERAGDVFYFLRPGYIMDWYGGGTGHGSPWSYDAHVPLLIAGRWVRPGRHLEACGPEDIAATVAAVLGIAPPSGNVGRAIGLR